MTSFIRLVGIVVLVRVFDALYTGITSSRRFDPRFFDRGSLLSCRQPRRSGMRVLVIGRTRFLGPRLVQRLAAAGHEVAVFHRGQTTAASPPDVRGLRGDRCRLADHAGEFRRLSPDVVVDMIPFT
jgi:hypothetical protein